MPIRVEIDKSKSVEVKLEGRAKVEEDLSLSYFLALLLMRIAQFPKVGLRLAIYVKMPAACIVVLRSFLESVNSR